MTLKCLLKVGRIFNTKYFILFMYFFIVYKGKEQLEKPKW